MIKTALRRLGDDTVSAFDKQGREIAAFVGPYAKMRGEILVHSDAKTAFEHVGEGTLRLVDRGSW